MFPRIPSEPLGFFTKYFLQGFNKGLNADIYYPTTPFQILVSKYTKYDILSTILIFLLNTNCKPQYNVNNTIR